MPAFTIDLKMSRPPKYPWKKWTNGKVHRIVAGKHFDSSVRGMQSTLRAHAARYNLLIHVRSREDQIEFVMFEPKKGRKQ